MSNLKTAAAAAPALAAADEYGPIVAAPVGAYDELGPILYRAPGAATYKGTGAASPLMGKVITLVTLANPKRPGSRTRARYALYNTGLTTDEYLARSVAGNLGSVREVLSDLNYDRKMGFITLA